MPRVVDEFRLDCCGGPAKNAFTYCPGNLGTKYEWKEAGCRLAATLHAPRQFIVIFPFLANSHDHGQFYSSLFFPELIVATTDGRRVGGFRKRRVEMRKWNPLIIFSSWEIVAKTGDISIMQIRQSFCRWLYFSLLMALKFKCSRFGCFFGCVLFNYLSEIFFLNVLLHKIEYR